jgi:IS30 family transposase
MSNGRIPPALEDAVFAKAGEGLSSRQIAAWLLSQHAVTTSHKTVAKLLARRRSERADVAKSVVREQLGKSLNADIARLEEIRADLAKRAQTAAKDDNLTGYAKLTELELKAIDRKLHYSGADEPDGVSAGAAVIVLPPEE